MSRHYPKLPKTWGPRTFDQEPEKSDQLSREKKINRWQPWDDTDIGITTQQSKEVIIKLYEVNMGTLEMDWEK